MKKQRMQADNVEQLMEIVRALQNGEEPDMEKIRAKNRQEMEERARQAEQEREEARIRRRNARIAEEKRREAALEEKAAAAKPHRENGTVLKENAPAEPSAKKRQQGAPSWLRGEPETPPAKPQTASSSAKKAETVRPAQKEVEVPELPNTAPGYFDEESEAEFLRYLDEEEMASLPPVFAMAGTAVASLFTKTGSGIRGLIGKLKEKQAEKAEETKEKKKRLKEAEAEAEAETGKEAEKEIGKEAGKEPEKETRGRKSGRAQKETAAVDGKKEPEGKEAEDEDLQIEEIRSARKENISVSEERFRLAERRALEAEKNAGQEGSGHRRRESLPDRKESLPDDGKESLKAGRREGKKDPGKEAAGPRKNGSPALKKKAPSDRNYARLIPVLIGIIAVIALILLFRALGNYLTERGKRKHVSSENGLVVSVEKEPSEWVNYAKIQLKLHGDAAKASSAEIDGQAVEIDENGLITAEIQRPVIFLSVQSEAGEQSAEITIPKLDNQEPVVTAARNADKSAVEIKAEDDASGVETVYYHIGTEDVEPQLTDYLEYKEPVPWEEGRVYRWYARDHAGNRTSPAASTMEDAQSIAIPEEQIKMFPGQSTELEVTAVPALSLLKGLTFLSDQPEVVSVDESGRITALKDGTAVITASAEGVESVSCAVDVSAERSVTVTALGDCTFGTYPSVNPAASFDAYAQMYGYSWFFDKVRSYLETDDVTYANLEGPLTTADTSIDKQFVFKGSPEYTQILTDGSVEVVTLANNHSGDYGEQGLEDTKKALEEEGIPYSIGSTVSYLEPNGVKTAFIGIYEPNLDASYETRTRETIAAAKEAGAQLIIVAYHWGSELSYYPADIQQEIGHLAIDLGADLVVGHHPHVVNGIEEYNGHYIVYSVGNFCFGGSTSPTDPDAMIVRQTFTITESGTSLGDLEVVPIRSSSDYSINNYQPIILEGDEASRVMDKINQYCAAYNTSFSLETLN